METSWQSGANLPYFIWPDETQFIKVILSSDSSIRSLTIWIIFHLYGGKEAPPPTPPDMPGTVNCEGISWHCRLSGLSHFKALPALGRRRGREISGLQQNYALQEPQLDPTWELASIETECTMRRTLSRTCVSKRSICKGLEVFFFKVHGCGEGGESNLCTFYDRQTIVWLEPQDTSWDGPIISFSCGSHGAFFQGKHSKIKKVKWLFRFGESKAQCTVFEFVIVQLHCLA